MRLTELLASSIVDSEGRSLGPVRDVRLNDRAPGVAGPRFTVAGLVIGDGVLARPAHAWGFAQGRACGPWLLRALTRPAVRQARFVPAHQVVDWGPGIITVSGALGDFPPLQEVRKP